MSTIDNIQKNIEEFRNNFMNNGIDGVLPDEFQEPQLVRIDIFIKQSHISFIENEIERLELEKGTIKINLRKINEIERIESITIPQDYESSYFLGRKIAIQDQIDYYKKTLALIQKL